MEWSEDGRELWRVLDALWGVFDKWGPVSRCALLKRAEGKKFPARCCSWARQGLHPFTCEGQNPLFGWIFLPSAYLQGLKLNGSGFRPETDWQHVLNPCSTAAECSARNSGPWFQHILSVHSPLGWACFNDLGPSASNTGRKRAKAKSRDQAWFAPKQQISSSFLGLNVVRKMKYVPKEIQ